MLNAGILDPSRRCVAQMSRVGWVAAQGVAEIQGAYWSPRERHLVLICGPRRLIQEMWW